MSWSFYAGSVDGTDPRVGIEEARAAWQQNRTSTGPEWDESVDEQVQAAVDAAVSLIESGTVGEDAAQFTVSLSGHANPGHTPTEGYANDAVTVSISQGVSRKEG